MKDRIYQLMKYQGMSQKEFAATLCIAEGTLSGISFMPYMNASHILV
jgi:transcriptional regulator with XRE-family HTH domain